jgi:hypothetical protein
MPNNRPKAWEGRQAKGRITAVRNRRRVEVLTIGTGMNTDSLVQNAIDRKEEADRRREPFNEIWCVFDRDSFPAQNFNRALQLAYSHGIRVAWANEAFEIWYLLHFHYYHTGMSRADYGGRLSTHLKCKYDKAHDQIYAKLEPYQPMAMKHARRLEKYWIEAGGCNRESANPSTNIHKLVEFLNEFKELGPADAD